MNASGVDKSRLLDIGRDILLVNGYDRERGAMLLSVPPDIEPRRVSVDAIEHWMIYSEHPAVGAILHVHGWMEGVPCTAFNYPCGTYELAKAVADMDREAEDPARAVDPVSVPDHGPSHHRAGACAKGLHNPETQQNFDRFNENARDAGQQKDHEPQKQNRPPPEPVGQRPKYELRQRVAEQKES